MKLESVSFPEPVLGLAEQLGNQLRQRGWTCATAESCTGGGIAYAITQIAGSSDYLTGGFVTYSNEAKVRVLDVRRSTLDRVGAVSEECAAEMAAGARRALDVDVAISSTGIAGPSGATARKPVGLVYIAVALPDRVETRKLALSGHRATIMQSAIHEALALAVHLTRDRSPMNTEQESE